MFIIGQYLICTGLAFDAAAPRPCYTSPSASSDGEAATGAERLAAHTKGKALSRLSPSHQ